MISLENDVIPHENIANLTGEALEHMEKTAKAIHRMAQTCVKSALMFNMNPTDQVSAALLGAMSAFMIDNNKSACQYLVAYIHKTKSFKDDIRKFLEWSFSDDGMPLSEAILRPDMADKDCDCRTCEALKAIPAMSGKLGENVLGFGRKPSVSGWGRG